MRTAEEILLQHIPRIPDYVRPNLIRAINEARKEAIEACAEEVGLGDTVTKIKTDILSLVKKIN